MRTLIGAIAATALVASLGMAQPVPVTACGQVVTGSGVLVADLDCSGEADEAVKLSGRLALGGFTLTGHPAFDVVRCEVGQCSVAGPGIVTGGLDGVRGDRGVRVEAGAVISGTAGDGVRSDGSAKVRDSMITANGGDGIRSKARASVLRSTVSGNAGDGVRADKSASVKDSTVTSNGGNGVDSELTAKAVRSSVTGNGFDGLKGNRVVLAASTATGNGTDAACGVTDECADLAAAVRPVVAATSTCGTSRDTENGGTWGVCAND
jgi:hypothetical protein